MSDFTSQYGTSTAGTLTAAVIFGIAWLVRNKCKHSHCAINSCCFKCEADDETTLHKLPRLPREGLSKAEVSAVGELSEV